MLSLPHDAKGSLPNCGLTAMAVASGKSLQEATDAYQKACEDLTGKRKQANWRGRTNHNMRIKALQNYLGLNVEQVDFQRPCNLRKIVEQALEEGSRYIITTTGHVQVVEDGLVIDQRGVSDIRDYWGSGKQVKNILKIS